MSKQIQLESSWLTALSNEFEKPYFEKIRAFLKSELAASKTIYPSPKLFFAAFGHSPLHHTKVVIIGQDPYHGPGQAHGLCFSVNEGIKPPPSLVNIFKELKTDLNIPIPASGNLTQWAEQGVLLLNAFLSVEAGKAGSHATIGWQNFTNEVIRTVSNRNQNVVFLLWGGFAKKKAALIDGTKHLILTSGHPSPLSANKGHWFGNKHFSQCNHYLTQNNRKPIDWDLNRS